MSANTTMALTAYYQFKAGLDIDAGFSKADEKATALLKYGKAWGGIKTNSFYQNLMIEIDPSKLDLNVSTMDMWMAIAFDYGDKVLDQGSKYRFAERETARLAQELGWTAHQVQAAIWSAMKGRIDPIRGQLKAEELRLGIGEMVNKIDPETGKESLVYEVKKDKKKEHFRLAHKMGMEYDLQDKDINAAKFDFSTALRDRMVQQSYETTPSTASGAPIPGIHTATLDKQFEYQQALYPVIFPDKVDIVAQMVGLPQGETIEGVSAWESKTQTGLQAFAPAPTQKSGKAKTLKPSAVKLLDLASRIRGYVLTQDAVAYHTAIFDDAKIRHNGIQLNTKNALSHQEIELFYRALHEKFNRWDLAPIYRKDGIRVLNFTAFDESQKPVSNKEFKKAWDEIITSLPDTFGGGIVDSVTFRSDGNLVSNDWSKDKNGEEYLASIERERPDLLQQVRNLRTAVQTVNDQFVAKYGWDKAGVSFARSERDSIKRVRGRDFKITAKYGTKQKGSVSVLGFHFSRAPREVLDSTFYGTGIKDAASERVRAATDKRLRSRTFFYVDRGVGYEFEELGVQPEGFLPEGGVGWDMHGVNLRNMYDAIADPLGFVAKGKTKADGNRFWFNGVETAILDAGFDGVYMPNAMSSVGVAVLLGKHNVNVQHLGKRNAGTGKMLTKRELQLQESYARVPTPNFYKEVEEGKRQWVLPDADGNPTRLYHGTYETATAIDPFVRQEGLSYKGRRAMSFTDDPEIANQFASREGQILPVFVSAVNPVEINMNGLMWNTIPLQYAVSFIEKNIGRELTLQEEQDIRRGTKAKDELFNFQPSKTNEEYFKFGISDEELQNDEIVVTTIDMVARFMFDAGHDVVVAKNINEGIVHTEVVVANADPLINALTAQTKRVTDAEFESFAREDESDAEFQRQQAERRAAQEERMKDLSPREQGNIIEAGVADYYEILDLKDKIDKLKKQIAGGTPAAVEKSKRTADLQTAAQRVNALSEVRKLERKLNAMTMLADQRLSQVNRTKARLQAQTQLAVEEQQSAAETIASLEEQITTTRDAVAAAKKAIAEEQTATKEQHDALNTALANAEATAQRAINWAYAIGRNEGLVAGQVAGQQTVQTDLERGQRAEEKLKELQKSERFQKFASQRAIDWAYRIGRNEGLVAGQVAGQQTLKPEMTRLARVESLLDISVRRVRELKATVRNDARAAQRAVNFSYSMGLNKGRMQGIMKGRAEILAKMRKREDTLQNQLFNLRDLMNTRLDDVAERNRIIRKIVSDALLALPAKLRGTLANRAATATTVAQANRVAIEAIRIAINAEVTDGIAAIKKTQKRMNKRGMKWAARQQIEKLLDEANAVLRDANNRKRTAKVVTAKGSPVTLVDAVALYADVIDANAKVENAVALYTVDRNEYIAERDQRIARYADLNKRILANMGGRKVRLERLRADQAPRLSLMSRISRANSDIYTLAIELEGTTTGVIDEMLRLAQEGKGEAALEHARLMRDLLPALQAAGYESLDDYRLRNGGYGDGSTELVTVSLGGKNATIPLGIAMSIAAMDEETLNLFNEGKQSLKFSATSTILEFTPTRADIELIRSNLTPEQRALIEASKDILETQIRDRAMEAIWQVQGDQPPIVLRYYPRIRDMTGTGGEQVSISAAIGAAVRGALTSVGFANARVGGNQPLIYSDMLQTMDRHIQVALDMIHMAQPYRDAMTVLNNPEVIKGIDSQLGVDTAKGVRSIFSNGVGATQRSVPTWIDTLTGNVTSAVLTMNPTTVAKVVLGGTIRLSSEVPLSVWTRGTVRAAAYARKPGRWSSRVDEIHLLNGYFTRRHQMQMKSIFSGALNDSDRAQLGNALKAMRDNFRATGQNLAARQITDAIQSVGDVNRAGTLALSAIIDALRYADEQIMMAAVESRLAEIEDEGILTGRDALREAANRAERDFRLTQNASDEFDDTYYAATSRTSGNSSWRILFPFSSDPLKARNQIRRAWLSGDKATMGRTAVAVGGNIGSSVAVSSLSKIAMAKTLSLIGSLLFGSDDDDSEDKEWLKQMKTSVPVQLVQELSQNILGYWGMVFANVLSAAVYSRSAGAPLIGTPAVQTYQEASKYWKKDSTAIDKTQAVIGSTLALVQYSGVPFYAIYRLVSTAIALNKSKPTEREKLLKSIERRREHLEKLRSN
ncbi:MAG: hypothetical protein WCO64_07975 [Actinomycetes bacterium]